MTYFHGPSVAQGTFSMWFAAGTVTLTDTAADHIDCKLWDGTTVIASADTSVSASSTGLGITISLRGVLANPAANIKISCKPNTTTATMKFNFSGNSKDSILRSGSNKDGLLWTTVCGPLEGDSAPSGLGALRMERSYSVRN